MVGRINKHTVGVALSWGKWGELGTNDICDDHRPEWEQQQLAMMKYSLLQADSPIMSNGREEEETICKSNKNSADFRMRQKHGVFVGVLVNWRMLLLAAVGETAQMNDVWIWRTV